MSNSISSLEEVRKAKWAAEAAVKDIQSAAKEAGREAARKAEEDYLKAHDIDAARARLSEATKALVAAEDQMPAHEWEGQRVFRMKNVGRGYMPRYEREEGIIETRRHATRFPLNQSWLPSVGESFVRLLKKDGTTGTRFVRMGIYDKWQLAEQPTPSPTTSRSS